MLKNGSFVSGSTDHDIRIWDLKGYCINNITTPKQVLGLDILNDEILIFGGDGDFYIRFYSLKNSTFFKTLIGHGAKVQWVKLISANLLLSGSEDKTLKVWDVYASTPLLSTISAVDKVLALDYNSLNVAAVGGDGSFDIRLFNLTKASGTLIKTLSSHTAKISSLKWLNSDVLISCSEDFSIQIWNVTSGSAPSKIYKGSCKCYSLEIINDGVLAAGFQDFSVLLLNMTNLNIIRILSGHAALPGVILLANSKYVVNFFLRLNKLLKFWKRLTKLP